MDGWGPTAFFCVPAVRGRGAASPGLLGSFPADDLRCDAGWAVSLPPTPACPSRNGDGLAAVYQQCYEILRLSFERNKVRFVAEVVAWTWDGAFLGPPT